jgi:DnaJ-class molecular chaperone
MTDSTSVPSKKRGRPRKQDAIIVDHSNEELCPDCQGRRVYQAGFKYWKTCPTCHGDAWIKRK